MRSWPASATRRYRRRTGTGASRPARRKSPPACKARGEPNTCWRLKQAPGRLDLFTRQLRECEHEIEQVMARLQAHGKALRKGEKRSKARNAPKFNVREQLPKMHGVDLTRIDGIDESTAQNIVAEVGTDLGRFPSDKHLASWLGICPGTRISGGKVLGAKNQAQRQSRQPGVPAGRRGGTPKQPVGPWARTTGACVPAWTRARPSAPQRTNRRACSTPY